MRAFRRPWLWLVIWLALVASVVVGSLLPADELPRAPMEGFDKIEHVFGYAVLSVYAVMLFARRRTQLLAALGLVLLGVSLELAQGMWAPSRSADVVDAVADLIGVVAGFAIGFTPLARMLERIDARLR